MNPPLDPTAPLQPKEDWPKTQKVDFTGLLRPPQPASAPGEPLFLRFQRDQGDLLLRMDTIVDVLEADGVCKVSAVDPKGLPSTYTVRGKLSDLLRESRPKTWRELHAEAQAGGGEAAGTDLG